MKRFNFLIQTEDEKFRFTIKSADNEGTAWYLVEKQFDDAIDIQLLKEEETC